MDAVAWSAHGRIERPQDGTFQEKEYDFKLQVPAKDGKLVTVARGSINMADMVSGPGATTVRVDFVNKSLKGAPPARLHVQGNREVPWDKRKIHCL